VTYYSLPETHPCGFATNLSTFATDPQPQEAKRRLPEPETVVFVTSPTGTERGLKNFVTNLVR
jgi:hypothetical protein